MSNLSENRIDLVLTPDTITTINESIATILNALPPNTSLSDDQRSQYTSIDVDNRIFCRQALDEAKQTGDGIIASYIKVQALENDLAINEQMDVLESKLLNLVQRVSDIKRISGHEAYKVSNIIYKNYKEAAEGGIDNAKSAYDRLKERYDKQFSGGRTPDTNVM